VVVATGAEGGTHAAWFTVITNPDVSDALECNNMLLDAPQGETLRENLQVHTDIYSTDSVAGSAEDVYDELLEVMRNVVDYRDVTSIPTLAWKEQHIEQCLITVHY